MNYEQLVNEFERQVNRLIQLEYFKLAKMTEGEFIEMLEPLRAKVVNIEKHNERHIPFVIVLKNSVVPAEKVLPLVEIKGNYGEVRMTPLAPKNFSPIEDLDIPDSNAYLLADIDTGKQTLNVTPHDALAVIRKENRLPLTIDEGMAVILHFPEVLIDKKKIQLLFDTWF